MSRPLVSAGIAQRAARWLSAAMESQISAAVFSLLLTMCRLACHKHMFCICSTIAGRLCGPCNGDPSLSLSKKADFAWSPQCQCSSRSKQYSSTQLTKLRCMQSSHLLTANFPSGYGNEAGRLGCNHLIIIIIETQGANHLVRVRWTAMFRPYQSSKARPGFSRHGSK